MQHRAILRSTKTGTITHAQALKAARAAKQARLAGETSSPKVVRAADSFGFGFGPAMGDPKGTELGRVRKLAAKEASAWPRHSIVEDQRKVMRQCQGQVSGTVSVP